MKRRILLAGIFTAPLAWAQLALDAFSGRALAFEKCWNPFVRRLFGCAEEGDTAERGCHLARSKVDFDEFRKAREKAKPLFGLRDK